MPTNANLNGTNWPVPNPGEAAWGPETTAYLLALATAFPQLGGTWTLVSELDLGAAFGLKSIYFKSRTANPAAGGILRLADVDSVNWRNAANSADSTLFPGLAANSQAIDALYWKNGTSGLTQQLTDNPFAEYTTAAGQSIPASTNTIINYGTLVTDTDSAVTTGAAWKFTVPANKGGLYLVSACCEYTGLVAPASWSIIVTKNSVAVQSSDIVVAISSIITQQSMSVSAWVNCAAGDTLGASAFQSTSGARTLTTAGSQNRITIKRVA